MRRAPVLAGTAAVAPDRTQRRFQQAEPSPSALLPTYPVSSVGSSSASPPAVVSDQAKGQGARRCFSPIRTLNPTRYAISGCLHRARSPPVLQFGEPRGCLLPLLRPQHGISHSVQQPSPRLLTSPGACADLQPGFCNPAPGHGELPAPMAGLEELKKKLQPLLFDDSGSDDISTGVPVREDTCDSYVVSDDGTVNLLSRSLGEYNINEHGFHKRSAGPDDSNSDEKAYRCATHEMHIFGAIGNGASSVVERAIFIPVHRILALKKINIFEKEKRQQILNEMRTLCEAYCYAGLVEFQGAFYMPDSGQISIALEYMDGGSLADVIKVKKSIPEPVLAHMLHKVLLGLRYLHEVRHLVHRDIKPANVLINLKGDTKITDFGISAGLDNTLAMCATFVGTVTYMSPERIRNENYSYAADIWSLGLTVLECATGKFPYDVNEGLANLMLQILDDPSPTPPEDVFSSEFCSFINGCLQKDADARPSCEQLLSHPFLKRYEKNDVDLEAYVRSVVNPRERLKQIAEMLAVHYYLLFNGSDVIWHHMKTFYMEESTFSFSGNVYVGQNDIFDALSNVRKKLKGDRPREKIVHVVEKLHCRANGEAGLAIRVSGSFIVGNQFLICGDGLKAEGMPSLDELSIDIPSKRVGQFREQFIMEPGNIMSCYYISKQDLYIIQV